uniref:Protein kinase n=1 Tax=Trypanosoma vivax (strain Y486) TaxID=1055687 RepID=G0UCE3_TRYVY|nr:protein kinase [Trypanosoma vivax Y486]
MISKLFSYDSLKRGNQVASTDIQALRELSMRDNISSVEVPEFRVRPTFVEYLIVCTKRNTTWQVFRRYQQFKTLDQKLKQLCTRGSPNHCEYGAIPALSGSHWTEVTNQCLDLVEKRRRYLEIYLLQLLVPGNVFYVAKTALYDFLHDGAMPVQAKEGAITPLYGFAVPAPTVDAHGYQDERDEQDGATPVANVVEGSSDAEEVVERAEVCNEGVKNSAAATVGAACCEECDDTPSDEENADTEDIRLPPQLPLCVQCNAEFTSVLFPHRCFLCRQRFCRSCLRRAELEDGEVARMCMQCYENHQRHRNRPSFASTSCVQSGGADALAEELPSLPGCKPPLRTDVSLSDFQLVTTIGRGTFGKVMKVIFKENGKAYAMKVLSKCVLGKRRMIDYIKEEKNIMDFLPPHPYVVTCHFSFQTDYHLFFVMDYLPGGDLYSRIYPKSQLSPTDVQLYMAEVVLALQHMHHYDVAHRDVKLENIVLGEDGHIRLTDFGLARMHFSTNRRCSFVGSAEYLPPETIEGKLQTMAVDWWSVGVMLYEMLKGETPFRAANNQEVYNNILSRELDLSTPCFSPEAASLIEQLLQREPGMRLCNAAQIKAHPYFASIDWVALEKKAVPAPVPLDFTGNDMKYIKWQHTAEWATIPKPVGVTRATIDRLIGCFSNFVHVSDQPPETPTSAGPPSHSIQPAQEKVKSRSRSGSPRPVNLVGVWQLAKVEMEATDGRVTFPWGCSVCGLLVYLADGLFSMQLTLSRGKRCKQHTLARATKEELVELCHSYVANFGRYQVKAGSNIVTHSLMGSLTRDHADGVQRFFFELHEKTAADAGGGGAAVLKLFSAFNPLVREQLSARTVVTWERVAS